MNEWHIQSRAHACEACQKAFTDQQPYHTFLFEEKNELRRQDLCLECGKERLAAGAAEAGFISHWHGVFLAPTPVVEAIQKATAETLLKQLIQLNDPRYIPAGFILAVMLERKRLLKVKEQLVREGKRVFVYEHPKSGEIFTITDPDLHLNQLEEVQRTVADLLEHGLPTPPTEQQATLPLVVESAPLATEDPAPTEEGEATPAVAST